MNKVDVFWSNKLHLMKQSTMQWQNIESKSTVQEENKDET